MARLRLSSGLIALTAAAGLAGCSTGPGGLGDVGSISSFLGADPSVVAGTPSDAYIRVARGAKACWLAPDRPLGAGYVFAADARPESEGGAAEIVVYERTPEGERGLKAFEAEFAHKGAGTAFGARNHRVSEPFGSRMIADVARWAAGETGCEAGNPGWAPQDPAAEDATPPKKKGKKNSTV